MSRYCKVCGKDISDIRVAQGKDTCSRSCAAKASALLRWQRDEEHVKLSNSVKKYFENPDNREKTAAATRAAMNRPDVKENHRQAMVNWANKVCTTDTYKQNMSNTLKEVYKSQELRDKVSSSVKRAYENPDLRAKLSASIRKAYENPEVRAKLSASVKAALSKPEVKENHSHGLRVAYSKNKDSILQKAYETKKRNHSFNSSSSEDKTFEILKMIFTEEDVTHLLKPYDDERYPYECDFYIKSLDLFIECNYHWTHGGRPFDETNESDIEQLSVWKEKAKVSQFYQNAIDTWTKRDVEKLQCAKHNNLNYMTFYSLEEFEEQIRRTLWQKKMTRQ